MGDRITRYPLRSFEQTMSCLVSADFRNLTFRSSEIHLPDYSFMSLINRRRGTATLLVCYELGGNFFASKEN
jgi:hypothetical protein